MGCFPPDQGEASKIVLVLKWRKSLKKDDYYKYKKEIEEAARKIGARIVKTELVSVEKESCEDP